jgi:hypothetical protein
LWLCGQLEVS